MSTEERSVADRRGKWSVPGVPHRGWTVGAVEDLCTSKRTCEMCEHTLVRYVHYMEHPNFDGMLAVGCICAGHMEGNIEAAKKRENAMKSRASKRKRWVGHRDWRVSKKGNPWIVADGYRVTVFPERSLWRSSVCPVKDEGAVRFSIRYYVKQDDAKLAAFDLISRILAGTEQLKT